jgi:rubrerythrin
MPLAITSLQHLREHLELAIKIELSTVPPYLYAMYSIADQQSDAALLIRSVVAEEMLHAVLAANLLLAVGGDPDFSSQATLTTYPSELPHHRPPLTLNLTPCTPAQVRDLFLVIEQPETHHVIPEDDIYESLGQFYHAIERGVAALAATEDLFANAQTDRQMAKHDYYAPVTFDAEESGGLAPINDIASANEAIHVIIHQGEGVSDEKWADPSHKELTHYYKFLRIADGDAPVGRLAAMPMNPRGADYPEPVRRVSDLFNAAYRCVYLLMHEIFQPGADRDALVGQLYRVMSDVMSPVGHFLVTLPFGDGVAAPTFEAFEFGNADPKERLAEMASEVAAEHLTLSDVALVVASL